MEAYELPPRLVTQLRVMRVVIVGLTFGVLGFLALTVFLRWSGQAPPLQGPPVISYLGAAVAAAFVPLASFLPGLLERSWRRQRVQDLQTHLPEIEASSPIRDLRWWMLYQTRLIISAALVEGPAILLLVAYLIEGQTWTVLLALVFVAAIAWKYPSQEAVERWIQEQDELARREEAGTSW